MTQTMTIENLTKWFLARGVVVSDPWLDELVREHFGKTEDQMDAIYGNLHK